MYCIFVRSALRNANIMCNVMLQSESAVIRKTKVLWHNGRRACRRSAVRRSDFHMQRSKPWFFVKQSKVIWDLRWIQRKNYIILNSMRWINVSKFNEYKNYVRKKSYIRNYMKNYVRKLCKNIASHRLSYTILVKNRAASVC